MHHAWYRGVVLVIAAAEFSWEETHNLGETHNRDRVGEYRNRDAPTDL